MGRGLAGSKEPETSPEPGEAVWHDTSPLGWHDRRQESLVVRSQSSGPSFVIYASAVWIFRQFILSLSFLTLKLETKSASNF